MIFKPHSQKQQDAIYSDKKIVAALTGIQWGKTSLGAIRTKMAMHKYFDKEMNHVIAAPTYKIMQQSTLPAFLRVMDGYGEYSKVDAVFTMHSGAKCWMRTGTEPDSIVGITNVYSIWLDEAGKMSLYFWENAQARAAFKNAPITLTSSPYTLNWLYKELVRPKLKNASALPEVDLYQASSWENPHFPREAIERARKTMDHRRFNAMFGGKWEKMEGLVYNCFDSDEHTINPFSLPQGTKVFAGIDWGTTAPFVIVVRAILPNGKQYQVSEFYRTGLTIIDMIAVAKQKQQQWGIQAFYCDPSAPGYIEEFNRAKLTAIPAQNDIKLGIDRHYELIRSNRYFLFRSDNKFTIDEYETYHYPDSSEDSGPDKDLKDNKPVKQNDHAMDANRYVTMGTYMIYNLSDPRINDDKAINKDVNIFDGPDHSYEVW